MWKTLKKLFCRHNDVNQSYRFEDKFSIKLPDGRVLTFVTRVLHVTYKCATCGKTMRKEIIYENKESK